MHLWTGSGTCAELPTLARRDTACGKAWRPPLCTNLCVRARVSCVAWRRHSLCGSTCASSARVSNITNCDHAEPRTRVERHYTRSPPASCPDARGSPWMLEALRKPWERLSRLGRSQAPLGGLEHPWRSCSQVLGGFGYGGKWGNGCQLMWE